MILIWISGIFLIEYPVFEAILFQSIVAITTASLAAALLLYTAFLYKISTYIGKSFLMLGIGILELAIGDFIYSYYELYTDISPFPSIADIFYLSSYVPLITGLILQMKLLKISLSYQEKTFIAIMFGIISIFVVITVIILPLHEYYNLLEKELIEYVISVQYPVYDLVLILCIMVVFAKLRYGDINIAWLLLLIGFLLITVADILFNWIQNVVEELLFEPFDLFFIIGYVLIINSTSKIIIIMVETFDKTSARSKC
jgi:hypothetical protein